MEKGRNENVQRDRIRMRSRIRRNVRTDINAIKVKKRNIRWK
jgi:hypothetical protein